MKWGFMPFEFKSVEVLFCLRQAQAACESVALTLNSSGGLWISGSMCFEFKVSVLNLNCFEVFEFKSSYYEFISASGVPGDNFMLKTLNSKCSAL